MDVERVDFVSFLTQDIPRAKRFYAETLGFEIETEGESDMEFTCGQVTLDIFDPSSIGQPFAPSPAGLALRVPDVAAARAELESKGVEFQGEIVRCNTDVSDTWEREGESQDYFDLFSPRGYAIGVNVVLYAMTH